jgi:acylphosphatase
MAKKQVHVYYSGLVQGVGFRFTAERFANKLDIKGWVKNLDDGRVEIVAEGDESQLNSFLSQLKNYFNRYLENIETDWSPASNEFNSFDVSF